MVKNLLTVASKGKTNVLWKVIVTENERIDFANNPSLCMN